MAVKMERKFSDLLSSQDCILMSCMPAVIVLTVLRAEQFKDSIGCFVSYS